MIKDDTLIDALRQAKAKLADAKQVVLDAEITLYEHFKNQLPEKGTFKHGDLKIVTGVYEKWSQDKLAELRSQYPDSDWPFVSVYQADNKAIAYWRDYRPDNYKVLCAALTTTPKKPAFSLKGSQDD